MTIVSRDLRFGLDETVPSQWSPQQPEFSHMATAFMAALPYLEPYFIQNIREAIAKLSDERIARQARAFIAQEARHAQQHRDWNRVVAARYPGFEGLERAIKRRLCASRTRHSLQFRLAYTAAYEALTYQVVCFIMDNWAVLLRDADARMLALVYWHAAEEVEHKSVAFDVFQALHGGYCLRILGLAVAFADSVHDIHVMMKFLLKADGLLRDRAGRRRLRALRLRLLTQLVPEIRHYLKPWYQPTQHDDPAIVRGWLDRYAQGGDLREVSWQLLEALACPVTRSSVASA